MTDHDAPVDVHTDDLSFKDAFQRAWVAAPTATTRNVSASFGALFFLGVHVLYFVMADNVWSLLAVPTLPVGAWFLLHGWVYQRLGERVLGLSLTLFGAMVPFYLA